MCWWLFKKKQNPEPIEKPDWVTQTREEVAQEEDYAAGIHYSIIVLIEEAETEAEKETLRARYGDEAWQDHWFKKHSESAWYIRNPEVE